MLISYLARQKRQWPWCWLCSVSGLCPIQHLDAFADLLHLRFDSREACDDVIKDFNNHAIQSGEEELQIQIRFADTQEQKSLKQQTQAARQFRSAEYEYATQAWRQGRIPYAGTTMNDNSNANEFEQYLGTNAGPIQGQRWAQSAVRQLPGRSPLSTSSYNSTSQPPVVQINVAPAGEGTQAQSSSDDTADVKAPVTSPATVQAVSPVDSATASEQE